MITAIVWSLLHFLWQGALLASIAAVGFRVLPNRLRYSFALTVFAAMAAAPIVTGFLLWPRDSALVETGIFQGAEQVPASVSAMLPATPAWAPIVLALWLAGVAAMTVRTLGGWILSESRFASGRAVSTDLNAAALRIAGRLGIQRAFCVLESSAARTPGVFGIWRPVILLPSATIAGLPTAQLEAILAHELAHIARHDFLVNCLQCVVEAVLFYHPAVWWLSNQIRQEREMCCDAIAAADCGDPILYSRALLSLEEFRNEPFALAATDGDLRGRIDRLLGLEKSQSRWSGSAALLLLLIVTATVAALAQQAPTPPKPRSIDELWIHSVEISPEEKDAFAMLQTEAERKRFIEQFWERRDPTPGTPRNEAKEEHDRRIRYSNQRFGSESREGWNTARGRIYIVHGPPDEIESHPAEKREVWFYHTGLQFEFQGEDYELASQKREVEAKPFFVASFDVSAVPEPARGQLSSELNAFKGQPISNALMDRIRAVVRRIQPDLVTTWALKRDTRTASVAVSPPWMK